MIQFNRDEVCHLIRACEVYKNHTGSDFMWEIYADLQQKLEAYGEEVTIEDKLHCPENN